MDTILSSATFYLTNEVPLEHNWAYDRTYPEPEHFGALHPYSCVLPREVLIYTRTLVNIGGIPVVWSLELF